MKGVFDSSNKETGSCLEHYYSEGWVLIKNFFDYEKEILPIHKDINNLIDLKRKSIGLRGLDSAEKTINNESFLDLCSVNRGAAGQVYRACRHLPSTLSLLTGAKCTSYAKLLMKTDYLNLIPYVPIRADIKGEEKYLLNWHQDYPYIQGSTNSVVIWTPLFNQKLHEGGVLVVPGSHKAGIRNVRILDPQNKNNKNGGSSIEMAELSEFDKAETITSAVDVTDALVFDTLLVHKSLPLINEKIRWSLQMRFADFNHEDAIRRGWPNGMIENNWFEFDHPEFVVS